MSNIVPVNFKPEVNESLVEMLEEALERARAGDLVSGKICCTTAAGEIMTDSSSTENAILEMAAVARLLHRTNLGLDENTR